jgi:hypothetical protein
MNILAGYFSIAFTFVLLATMFLWFFIKGGASVWLKLVAVPVVLWYTLALYYAPDNLMGWPTPEGPPGVARVINGIVKQPKAGDDGAIYLWMISLDKEIDYKKSLKDLVNPKNVFDYNAKNVPRAYILPYDKNLDRQLTKGKNARLDDLGVVIVFKRKGKGKLKKKGEGEETYDDARIEILNLKDTLKKIEKNLNKFEENLDFQETLNREADRLRRMGGT